MTDYAAAPALLASAQDLALAENRLHVAAIECANAVYDKAGLRAIDLLDAALAYARAVNGGKYGRVETDALGSGS